MDNAINHIATISSMGISIIELGYWKQTSKSNNPFYNMNETILSQLTKDMPLEIKASAMIDFHYCSKNLDDYPDFGSSRLEIIRLTSRKEDFDDAMKFAKSLKEMKGLTVSFQIINSSNYSKKELQNIVEKLIDNNLDMVAFADSHGNLNLIHDMPKYSDSIKLLEDNNIEWGFHLHDHTGRAALNYWILTNTSCDYMDISANGVGKGVGNLKMEHVVPNEMLPELLTYMTSSAHNEISIKKIDALNLITGRMNVTDNYAKYALKNNLTLKIFMNALGRIKGKDKDTYNESLIISLIGK
jgi:4-hydroxy 2-oxovalerate aldolase